MYSQNKNSITEVLEIFEFQIKFLQLLGIIWVFLFEMNTFHITQTLVNLAFVY